MRYMYTKHHLEAAGKALYGDRWQTDLSRDLHLSDARRIRQWMAGERPIPNGIWDDLRALLSERQLSIQEVLDKLDDARE